MWGAGDGWTAVDGMARSPCPRTAGDGFQAAMAPTSSMTTQDGLSVRRDDGEEKNEGEIMRLLYRRLSLRTPGRFR